MCFLSKNKIFLAIYYNISAGINVACGFYVKIAVKFVVNTIEYFPLFKRL